MERWRDMNKKLKLKIHESLSAVIPITLIVLALGMTVVPMELSTLMLFLAGAALLILGMGFFTLGADMAMMPIGEQVGTQLTRSKRLWLIVAACFVIGVIITVAEPDLQVLARQTPAVPDRVLIFTVAAGVGFFLVVSFLRILFGWNLSWLLIGFYIVVFALAAFVPDAFLAVAFDSGGVTTGPITVPFIMALGLGLTAVRGDKNAESDSFGLVALCSIGPILSVLILGMIYNPEGAGYTPLSIPDIASTRELWLEFGHALPDYAKEVLLALAPILAFFVVFQVFFLKLRRKALVKILVGMLYTLVGLTLFLTGVNVGFMPAGNYIGKQLAELPYNWVLVPLGMLIGYYIVKAEPAVLVLNKQVEEITGGAISQKVMMAGLSIGMSVSSGAFDGTRADGRFSAVVPGAGLCACARPQLSCAQDLYSHCLRFRRRGLRPHDGHVSAALCHGRVRGRGGQYSDRRLRHRGHGRHDAAHHHPDHRPCVPVQNAPCAGSGRSARGAGRGDHRIRRIGRGGRNMTDFISPVRCMVTIVDRGKGDRVVDLCRARHVAVQLVMLGHGTASAEGDGLPWAGRAGEGHCAQPCAGCSGGAAAGGPDAGAWLFPAG